MLCACGPRELTGCGTDAILLVAQPLPALAPLLFSARGVIARTGAAGSHLAGVARSLGVPMVIGCRPEAVTGLRPHVPHVPHTPHAADGWLAAVDGSSGDVALLSSTDGGDDIAVLARIGRDDIIRPSALPAVVLESDQ